MQKTFYNLRCAGTPWCLIQSPDYREAIKQLSQAAASEPGPQPPSLWAYDIINGHRCINEPGDTALLGSPDETAMAPAIMLKKAQELPANSILFFVVPTPTLFEDAPVIQAMANLRNNFKGSRRTVVLLARDLKLPPFLAEDVPILVESLPDDKAMETMIQRLTAKYLDLAREDLALAVDMVRGLTLFAAEEAVAGNLTKRGLDMEGLGTSQRLTIENATNKALVVDRGTATFDVFGGYQGLKRRLTGMFSGPRRPTLILRIDELDKEVSAGSEGASGDNTGVQQYQLKQLLTTMEDFNLMGMLLVGGPGTGKTLATTCTGNTFKCRTLVGDLGANRSSLVGSSEAAMRRMMQMVTTIGGSNVLVMATCNKLETLPAALTRRFRSGIWYFDPPGPEDRQGIWRIQAGKFGVSIADLPNDDGFTGSDIRNVCETAWMVGCSVKEAARSVTINGRTAKDDIERLRDMAEARGFTDASTGETYRRPSKTTDRQLAF